LSEYTGYPPNSPEPVVNKVEMNRVGTLKPGMHAAAGSWIMDKVNEVSDNAKETTYQQTADGLTAKDPTGFSYSAKLDGRNYPVSRTTWVTQSP